MKTATFLLVIFTCLAGYSQNLARSFRSQFGSLQFINDKVILSGICNNDQLIASDVRGEGTYSINNDTIAINFLGNKYLLLRKSDGIIIALSNILDLFKINEVIYATKYFYSNAKIMMIGGQWKNGGKNGKWLFFDENGVMSGLIFDEGRIVGTYIPTIRDE